MSEFTQEAAAGADMSAGKTEKTGIKSPVLPPCLEREESPPAHGK